MLYRYCFCPLDAKGFKSVGGSPFAGAATWAFNISVSYVIQDHPAHIPRGNGRLAVSLPVGASTFAAMNVDIWLPPVLAAVIGPLLSPSVGEGLIALAGARAPRIKHVPVDDAELYANGVPMDEAQFRSAFGAYQAELDALPRPPTAASGRGHSRPPRLSGRPSSPVPTLMAPSTSGDPDQAWEWYRNNNPYVTAALPRRHGFRLLPPGEIATD
jgi:hypothetical protein